MSSSYKKNLDQLERSERLFRARNIAWAVLATLPLVGFMAIYIPTGSREIKGTVISLHADSSEYDIWHSVVVRLDTGPTVQAQLAGNLRPKSGQRVAVTETRTALFGLRFYRCSRIIDAPEVERGIL